ncbi:MAG TPA: hypothetical protein VFF68_01940, partial [Anaerolineaceae bacterium]|nr:hypothetical protein [Anaerolineaceae bacterium]
LLPVLVPLIFFRNTWPGPRDPAAWSDGLRAFRSQVEADLAAGRSVLISEQPQLIPFGFWESPPAFPEFEKIFMFEAAITQNRAYLTDLYHALEEQRFDRIVTEPLYLKYQGKTAAFGEENDAWVYWIAEPLMCFYEPVQTWNSIGVQYLAPRTPDPSCDLDQRLAALP